MTTKESADLIGRETWYTTPLTGLVFRVRILDVHAAYGRTDVKVTPIGGSGEAWVSFQKLTF